MNISAPFIVRPVATTLLTIAVILGGAVAFFLLPVSSMPQVDIPTIFVSASLPGASPEVVAATVATPLERHLGEIASVTEMTSHSSLGSTFVVLQFDLHRDIDGAARDVEAAIEAARVDLPSSLRANPTYRKFNPANAPIMTLTLESKARTQGQLYDVATNIIQPALAQLDGVGNVNIAGSSLPAVRVELNPRAMFSYGIGPSDVQAALSAANADSPKGELEVGNQRFQIYANDLLSSDVGQGADLYGSLIIASRNNRVVRLSDVADVYGGVEDIHNAGYDDDIPCVIIQPFQQPGANIIQTVDHIRAILPRLNASLPKDVQLKVRNDQTVVVRASLADTGWTLCISVVLVIVVVYLFLRSWRATAIPCVAVPVSLTGAFGVMYFFGFTLDNLSLMALTVATGFVVDDAIVVLENTTRHIEAGMPRLKAAFVGAKEVGFTVVSMTISLCAVFLPIPLLGGVVGKLFFEFVMTLTAAIGISLLVSLTTTPMLCGLLLKPHTETDNTRFKRWLNDRFEALLGGYTRTLDWALNNGPMVMIVLAIIIGLNFHLYKVVPKGFFPQQDMGRMVGNVRGDQSASFELMKSKIAAFERILHSDPAVDTVQITTGTNGGGGGSGQVWVSLKPLAERKVSTDDVIARLRDKANEVPGAKIFLFNPQDLHIGGRQSDSPYQFTLLSDDVQELRTWTPKLEDALKDAPQIADVNTDQQERGLESDVEIDRETAARFGLTTQAIDNAMQSSFAQRIVSTIYNQHNQYHVIEEVSPKYWQSPEALSELFVSTFGANITGSQQTQTASAGNTSIKTTSTTAPLLQPTSVTATTAATTSKATAASSTSAASTSASSSAAAVQNLLLNALANTGRGGTSSGSAVSTQGETMVPFPSFTKLASGATPTGVNHQTHFAAATVSFNLAPGYSLSDATRAVQAVADQIGMPSTIHTQWAGTAGSFQKSLGSAPLLILASIVTVYIVLGILYESYVHPLTIISTLPSAGIGAFIFLLLLHSELGIMGYVGLILLIGIVKKNAIIMVDFAIVARRDRGLSHQQAIYEACRLRFRPITMTTMAALLGALPLVIGLGEGAELRQPLGYTIFGGLLLSQILTLYTTPVVYLYLARFSEWLQKVGLSTALHLRFPWSRKAQA